MGKLFSDIACVFKIGYSAAAYGKKQKIRLFVVWGLILLSYFTMMLGPTFHSYLLNGIASLPDPIDYSAFQIAFTGLALTAVSKYVTYAYTGIMQERISSDAYYKMQKDYLNRITKIKYSYFNSNKFHDLLDFVITEIPNQATMFVVNGNLITLLGAASALIFVMVSMINVNVVVAALIFVGNLFSIFRQYYAAKINYYNLIDQIPEKRWSDTYREVITDRKYMKENRLLELTEYLLGKWRETTKKLIAKNNRILLKVGVVDLLNSLIIHIFNIAALILTSYLIFTENTPIGSFMLVYSSLSIVTSNSDSVYQTAKRMKILSSIVKKYREFEALEEIENDEIYHGDEPESITIKFENVKFKYEGAEDNAVDGISVSIRQGEHIAVVGENGSGKTTFVHLLNGLYQPDEGEIFINDVPLSTESSLMKRYTTTLFQDCPIYEFSIKENIQVGNIYDSVNNDDIKEAAKSAGICDFIDTLNNGYDTNIGALEENGIYLSGGQAQKLALARALIRKKAKLLIMDEPTAALDPRSESRLYEEVQTAAGGRTTIMVSHRLGATSFMDRILVFEKGKIIEDGSHSELINKKGVYYNMYNAQAHWYL